MLKLLLDMNLSPKRVPLLQTAGYDCVHWHAIGRCDANDKEIVERAKNEKKTIITNDLDFGAILAETGFDLPSVLLVRYEILTVEYLVPRLVALLAEYKRELEDGALLVADERHIRLRSLPLR